MTDLKSLIAKLNEAQYRGLAIVRNNPGIGGADFAELMWPRPGRGWCVAGWNRQGAARCGGGLLSKWSRKGWIAWQSDRIGWRNIAYITAAGIAALKARDHG